MTDDLVPIGRFARAARLSHKALRLYDENGLLPPVRVDADSGYRYYAWEQLRTARRIALLREAGMPLAEIGRFLAEPRPEALDAYRARLEHLQPAGDPWMNSWLNSNRLRIDSELVLRELPARSGSASLREFALELWEISKGSDADARG